MVMKVRTTGVITVLMPQSFQKHFETFLKLVENDSDYKAIIANRKNKDGESDKRYKKSSGAKIRFVISKYVAEKLRAGKEATNGQA